MTPVDVRDVIVQSLMGSAHLSQVDREAAADAILKDLTRAGVEVMAPQDLAWGSCPDNAGQMHGVALSMCVSASQYDPE